MTDKAQNTCRSRAGSPRDAVTCLWRCADRTLLRVGVAIAAMAPVSAALALVDGRALDGTNVWFKPLKFQMSVSIFLVTLAVMMPLAAQRFRAGGWGKGTVWLAVGTSVFEIVWITFRAAMGERSHYATDTPFGGVMYALMGIAAVLLSLTPVIVSISAMFARYERASFRVLRLGALLVTTIGLVGATGIGIMLGGSPDHYPTDPQDARSRVPLVGWSVDRGDLRIAHFVGLHATQGLLVASLLLISAPRRIAYAVLIVVGLAWLAAVVLLASMALEGRSPLAPLSPLIDTRALHAIGAR